MSTPPTGTVTFLFTDIEDSTKLAQAHPAEWPALQARHHAILRAAIESHGGHVYQIIGDAFCSAFHTAPAALSAALAAQRTLNVEPWGEAVVHVRMGLHTGPATLRSNGEYEGYLALARAQRIMSAAHGGQTLVSNATAGLLSAQLPPGVSLRDMGEHRLKSIVDAERLWQVVSPDVPHDFPTLQTLNSVPNNLPISVTSFVGRERELSEVRHILGTTRLLTLTGVGGSGKTRLTLQVAAELMEQFADGVFFVPLAELSDPKLVSRMVAQAFGLRDEANLPAETQLLDYLRDKHLLLVLDNFEQLIDGAALVGRLISAAPRLSVLVTSRELLGIYGESGYAVPPLALPDPKQLSGIEQLAQCEAVALFVERARAAKNDFALRDDNVAAVAEICLRLDGLPLAIELAAVRVRLLAPQQMLTQLDNRLKFLTGGARDRPTRQQTLRGALDWSHQLLNPEEQMLFRRLAVFVGGGTLEAIEAVCDRDGALEVISVLQSLVDKSLIKPAPIEAESRFVMLETIREYAREKLLAADDGERVQIQHRNWCLAMAEEAARSLTGSHQAEGLARLEREHDNLRAALSRNIERSECETALRLAVALFPFWEVRGYHGEGRRWLAQALELGGDQAISGMRPEFGILYARAQMCEARLAYFLGDYAATRQLSEQSLQEFRQFGDKRGVVQSLETLGRLACGQGDMTSARTLCEQSLSLGREVGDEQEVAYSLMLLGNVASNQGDYVKARSLYEQSLTILRAFNDTLWMTYGLTVLGNVASKHGDLATARTSWEEGLAVRSEVGDRRGLASSLNNLGTIAELQGDHTAARTLYAEGLALRRELGDKPGIALSLNNLGRIALAQHEHAMAKTLLAESLSLRRELDNKRGMAASLAAFAALAAQGSTEQNAIQSARLSGAAQSLLDSISAALDAEERVIYERAVGAVRARLDAATFEAAWDTGRHMTLEQMLAEAERVAVSEPPEGPEPASPSAYSAGLTAREREVLRLLAEGLSNEQIAERGLI